MNPEGIDCWGLYIANSVPETAIRGLIELGVALPPDPSGRRNLMGAGLVISSRHNGWTTIWGRDPSVESWARRVGRRMWRRTVLVSPWKQVGVRLQMTLPTLRVGMIHLPTCLAETPAEGRDGWPPALPLTRYFRSGRRRQEAVAALEKLDAAWARARLTGRTREPSAFPNRVARILGLPGFEWELLEDLPVLLDATEGEAQEELREFDAGARVLALRSLPVLAVTPAPGSAPDPAACEVRNAW